MPVAALQKGSKWSDRGREGETPVFPWLSFLPFRFSEPPPGVLQIVGYGRTAISVSDEEIRSLELAVSSGMPKQPWPYLELGQRVRVNYGTLSGLEGILVNVKGNHRVVVSVTLLQRSVAMEVDSAWLSPIGECAKE